MKWFALLGCLLIPFAVGDARADDEDAGALTADEKALLTWWDGLGYPDVGTLRLVRVAQADWIQWDDDATTPIYDHAFLLSDDGATFRVFTTDLRTKTLTKTQPDVKEVERIGFNEVDLESFVRDGLKTMKAAGDESWWDRPDPFGLFRWSIPNHAFRTLVLARACAARGLHALAHELLTAAYENDHDWKKRDDPAVERFAQVKQSLAGEMYTIAIEHIAKAECSNGDLASVFRTFAETFSDDPRAAGVMKSATVYATWTTAIPKTADATLEQEIEYWIRVLQRTPRSTWEPGEWGERDLAPERVRLVRFEAVPQLIALIGSDAPSRTLMTYFSGKGQYRNWLQPLSLGDVAASLLREIAAGALDESYEDYKLSAEEREAKLKKRADIWWADVQAQGELDVLARSVEAAQEGSRRAAKRLMALDVDRAVVHVMNVVRKAKTPWPAASLVELIATRPEPVVTDALIEILEGPFGPRLRLEAAKALHVRGHDGAVPAMVAELHDPSEQPIQEDVGLAADPGFSRDLLRFLAGSRDSRAYVALARDLDGMSDGWRFTVTAAFLSFADQPADPDAPDADLGEAAARALEDLLAARLRDQGEAAGVHMSIGGTSVDTRVGQVAARALWVQFPRLYHYDPKASSRLREKMRRASVDLYRERRGLPALPPLVEKPPPERAPNAVVLPLVNTIVTAGSEDDRRVATAALEALGVGAVPVLIEAADGETDVERKQALSALASRQASIVTEIMFTDRSAPADKALRALVDGMRGKPFDGPAYVALILHVTQEKSAGMEGVRVRASRDDDLRGVKLEVTVIAERYDDGMNSNGWAHGTPGGGWGSMALDYGRKASTWQDEGVEVDRMLGAPAHEEVFVRFSVVRQID